MIQINRVCYVTTNKGNVVKCFSDSDRRTVWRSTSSMFLSLILGSCGVQWINHWIPKLVSSKSLLFKLNKNINLWSMNLIFIFCDQYIDIFLESHVYPTSTQIRKDVIYPSSWLKIYAHFFVYWFWHLLNLVLAWWVI